LKIVRPLDDRRSIAAAILGLGRCALQTGANAAALDHCRESLQLSYESDEKSGVAAALVVLAETAFAGAGTVHDAQRLLAAANALRHETGTQPTPQEAERIVLLEAKIGSSIIPPSIVSALEIVAGLKT
jgi:hypothetical protein